MQTIRIKCPKCGVLLDVRNTGNEAERTIGCPNCNSHLKVKFKKKPDLPPVDDDDAEEFGTNIMSGIANTNVGKLLYGTTEYPLILGVNTIGRKATTSAASLQIPTDDRSMSRMHSIIEVGRLYDGSVRTVIKNADNKNPTFVGGQRLLDGDRIVLRNGDVIKMGNVVVTFINE